MHIESESLDDLLGELYPKLLESTDIVSTSRGKTREILSVHLELTKPRARLSRTESRGKPFSCLGELLWYLSRRNDLDFIRHYIPDYKDNSDDGVTIYGGYGPRLFDYGGINQVQSVIDILSNQKSRHSRRVVIQLFGAADITIRRKEVPCTNTIQFIARNGQINTIVNMRSNDAYKGLPHDVFCFTMLQEIIARSSRMNIGKYSHFVGSMHIYEEDEEDARKFLSEKFQPIIEMPQMPSGDPWRAINLVLDAEDKIRREKRVRAEDYDVEEYWRDIIRLLSVFAAAGDDAYIDELARGMTWQRYKPYVAARKGRNPRNPHSPAQYSFDFL